MFEKNQIGNMIFDLSFDSEQDAYAFQSEAESFIQNEVLREVNEVFEKLDEKDRLIQIESLHLNLGTLNLSNYKNEFCEKLKLELYEKLRDEIASAIQMPSSESKVVKKEESDTELLIHFLTKGQMPWNNSSSSRNLNEVLKRSLNSSNVLIECLKSIGNRKIVRRRIIHQFSESSIMELIQHLDKANYKFYQGYAEDLHFTYHEKPISRSSESDFQFIVWDVILVFLLNSRGSYFNQKSFMATTLADISKQLGISYYTLLNQFLQVLNHLDNLKMYHTDFPMILKELGKEQDNSNYEMIDSSNHEKLLSDLKYSFAYRKTNFSSIFMEMAEHCPSVLILNLYKMISSKQDRLKLIEMLGHTQLKGLIRLLQATEGDFIIDFIEKLQVKNPQVHETIVESTFKKAKWEIGLSFLFEERGSRFNRKAFVKHSIFGIADHYNLLRQDLVFSLHAELENSKYSHPEQALMKEILEEMRREILVQKNRLNRQGDQENIIFTQMEYFEYLLDYLRGKASLDQLKSYGENMNENKMLLELEKYAPNLLSRFLDHVFAPGGIEMLLKNTSIDFIHGLIALCMKHFQSATNQNINLFLEAAEQYSIKTNYKIAFYTHILSDIINSKEINLDKVIMEIKQYQENMNAMDVSTLIDLLSLKTHIINFIQGKVPEEDISLDFLESWNYLFEHYSDNIDQTLQSIVQDERILTSFIEKCSDDLLMKIVRALKHTNREVDKLILIFSIMSYQQSQFDKIWRFHFYKTSIRLISESRDVKGEHLLSQIFLKIWDNAKDNKAKSECLSSYQSIVQLLRNKKEESLANKIDWICQNLKSEWKGENNSLPHEHDNREEVYAYLKGDLEAVHSNQRLHRHVLSVMKNEPHKMANFFLANFSRINIWIKQLPEYLLLRIVFLLFPKDFLAIEFLNNLIWNASTIVAKQEYINLDIKIKYTILFESLGKLKIRFSIEEFSRLILYNTLKQLPNRIHNKLLNNIEKNTEKMYKENQNKEAALLLLAIQELSNHSSRLLSEEKSNSPVNEEGYESEVQEAEGHDEKIYIDNAGMVLANPYLPELFKRLNLLGLDHKDFKDRESAEKAIHILEYMVNETCQSPEYKLLLNKILCGVQTGIPIKQTAEITKEDKQLVDGLVQAIISNWKAIGNTSVNGLRESFLQREGVLSKEDNTWQLQVELKSFDMLLDQLSWSYNTIKYPWMKNVLYVKWR